MKQAGAWVQMPGKHQFSDNLATAYHGTSQRVVTFDGGNGARTWEWDGANWTKVATFGPANRLVAMVENEASNSCFVFGGRIGQTYVGEPWEWTGEGWTKLPDFGPEPREDSALAYDAERRRVVLFGGWRHEKGTLTLMGDTWEWDGIGWSPRSASGPPPRYHHAMVYDRARKKTVLFGGDKGVFGTEGVIESKRLGDTWTWDGAAWTQVADTGPTARSSHQMAFDTVRERVLLFGGTVAKGTSWVRGKDTWEWDGHHWTQVGDAGPHVVASANSVMAFDRARGRAVLISPTTPKSTWEWVPEPTGEILTPN